LLIISVPSEPARSKRSAHGLPSRSIPAGLHRWAFVWVLESNCGAGFSPQPGFSPDSVVALMRRCGLSPRHNPPTDLRTRRTRQPKSTNHATPHSLYR
jgi:hypothetical protein